MMIKKLFTEHPASVNETYLQHLKRALLLSLWISFAGFACFVHSLLPFLFIETATKVLETKIEKYKPNV